MAVILRRAEMSKLFCIMGKSASGKDTIFKRLVKDRELDLKTVVSYTTRPMREGEREGVEYPFSFPTDAWRFSGGRPGYRVPGLSYGARLVELFYGGRRAD